MAKINKTQSNKKLKLPNIKRRNNRVAVLKVHLITMRLAYQTWGLRGKDLVKNFPQYNKSTIYKHWKLPFESETHCVDQRRNKMGRSKKPSDWDCQFAIHKILFTLRRPQVFSWSDHVSNRKFRWAINETGYNYFRSREKSLRKKTDVKKRLEFCKNRLKNDGCT